MTAIKSHQSRVFEQLVAKHRQELLESLVNYLDPMVVGRIRGLDEALLLSEKADYQLSGEEPDAGS